MKIPVKVQIDATLPKLLAICKKKKIKFTKGKTPSGMTLITLEGPEDVLKRVRVEWSESVAVTPPPLLRFPNKQYYGHGGLFTLANGVEVIIVAPDKEALARATKALLTLAVTPKKTQPVQVIQCPNPPARIR